MLICMCFQNKPLGKTRVIFDFFSCVHILYSMGKEMYCLGRPFTLLFLVCVAGFKLFGKSH